MSCMSAFHLFHVMRNIQMVSDIFEILNNQKPFIFAKYGNFDGFTLKEKPKNINVFLE